MLETYWPPGMLSQRPDRPKRKPFVPLPKRTYHGGPEVSLRPSKSSKRNRGLRQSQQYSHGPVRVIVRSGRVLMPTRYKAIQRPSLSAESHVTAQESSGSEGARIATPSPLQHFPTVENVAERKQDSPAS